MPKDPKKTTKECARRGCKKMMKRLMKAYGKDHFEEPDVYFNIWRIMGENKHFRFFKWCERLFIKKECQDAIDYNGVMEGVIFSNDFHFFRRVYKKEWYADEYMQHAYEVGNLRIIRYMHKCEHGAEYGPLVRPSMMCQVIALRSHHFHVLSWLQEKGMLFMTSIVTMTLVGSDDLKALKWMRNHGYKMHPGCMGVAVSNGHIRMIKWLIVCGMSSNGIYKKALQYKSDQVIRWIQDHGKHYGIHT